MSSEEIIACLNEENAKLTKDNTKLTDENRSLRHDCEQAKRRFFDLGQAHAFEGYRAQQTISNLHQQIAFLQGYIAHFERKSNLTMTASEETAEFFQCELAANSSSPQWCQEVAVLSAPAQKLQRDVLSNIQEKMASDEKIKRLIKKVTEIEGDKSVLDRNLKENKRLLDENDKKSQALISARDDLNQRLVKGNKQLQERAKKIKVDLRLADKHKETLLKEADVLKHEYQAALDKSHDLHHSVGFLRGADRDQMNIISSLQRQVAELKSDERTTSFTRIIKEQKATINALERVQVQKESENLRLENDRNKAVEKMTEHIKIAAAAEKQKTQHKGEALAGNNLLLQSLWRSRMTLSKRIADEVFNLLKDLNGTQKARKALDEIRAYLESQGRAITSYRKSVEVHGDEVQIFIQDILKKTPVQADPEALKGLMDDIRGIQKGLEQEIAKDDKNTG